MVDFTTGNPKYAVNPQENVEKHVFSLAKIAPMFVAFRLQERLRNQFATDSATNVTDLVKHVEAKWKPEVWRMGTFKNGFHDFPKLQKIFKLSPPKAGGWEFEFIGADSSLPWGTLEDLWEHSPDPKIRDNLLIPQETIDRETFWDRLKLSIRMSDNAAGSVASDLGLSYILGTLVNEGFYTNTSKAHNGLWLSDTYGYYKDKKWGGVENTAKDNNTAGATAFSVAAFFTLLVDKKLVDKPASEKMLDLLKERSTSHIGTGSRFTQRGGYPRTR